MKKVIAAFASVALLTGIAAVTYAHDNLSGTLSLSGAWAIYPLAVKWGEAFQKEHPGVKLDISAGGAGKGMSDALTGAVDIGMVSREVDKTEREKGAFTVFIAKDGVFATISSKNPAGRHILEHGITREKLADIFVNGSVTNWKQVGGPAAAIHVYIRSDACGAGSAWASTLGKYKQENLKGIGVYGDPGLLEVVRRDKLGIGYNNLGFVFNGDRIAKGIYIVPIDVNHNGKVDPSQFIDRREKAYKAISSGKYPGARREFFVTRGKPGRLASEFIKFALSNKGSRILEELGGYVPLSGSERADQVGKIR